MKINVRDDSVEVEGYVNAIERKSKPIRSRGGRFVERIKKGAFRRALERNDNVRLLLNHNKKRDLGGTKDGNLELREDNIGLHARAIITDPEVVEKAKRGDLIGWSFGFTDRDVDEHDENGMRTRDVKDLDLEEVSLLDRTRSPAYEGTLVSVRSEDENDVIYYGEELIDDNMQIREIPPKPAVEEPQQEQPKQPEAEADKPKVIDYSKFESMIQEMKGE